jgi:hypothetical protein
MEEDFGMVGKEKVDTYHGTWNGIGDWDTYTGDKK